MTQVRRALYYGLPLVACLIVFRYGIQAWFSQDDFAWLGIKLEVNKPSDIFYLLFRPQAQGTVRVISERLYFLTLSSWFGMNPVPFRVVAFGTMFANLFLLSWIAQRLTGSKAAGFAAPMFWVFNLGLAVPLSWAASYNQVLFCFVLLFCFWCFLRYVDTGRVVFWILQWIVFILGFGVLELTIVYPALVLLYSLCCARAFIRKVVWLFIPSVLFFVIHTIYVPKDAGGEFYRMYFDSALISTFWHYLSWAVGPSQLNRAYIAGMIVTVTIAVTLALFAALQSRRGNWVPLFLIAWFVIVIAPLVPLKNHQMNYYIGAPSIGLVILAAWAFVSAWSRPGIQFGVLASVLAALYCLGCYREIRTETYWRYHSSRRLESFVNTVVAGYKKSPKPYVLISGMDRDLYAIGFFDEPFRLYGMPRPYLMPGTEQRLVDKSDPLRDLDRFTLPLGDAISAARANEALAFEVTDSGVRDITSEYALMASNQTLPAEQHRVDVSLPSAASRLGPTWYPAEGGFRWMPETATVRLAAPSKPEDRLHVAGYCPASVLKSGPVHLTVRAGGVTLGTTELKTPDQPFEVAFPLPAKLVGQTSMEVELAVDRVTHVPGDERAYGLVFGTLDVRP